MVLARTPGVVDALLRGLPSAWITGNEGGTTWSPFDVVGHLIHADKTNWMPRLMSILEQGDERVFPAFDRLGQVAASAGRTLPELLDEFAVVRAGTLDALGALDLQERDLDKRGRHPEFGPVTARQLLSTWVAHDLDHLVQITRTLAVGYTDAVGPWRAFLRVIKQTVA
jgi:hypothetical protein